MTGHEKVFSNAWKTGTGSEAELERMKRRGFDLITAALRSTRDRMAWCMVGTAVYQVGFASSIQEKNFNALKPGVQ